MVRIVVSEGIRWRAIGVTAAFLGRVQSAYCQTYSTRQEYSRAFMQPHETTKNVGADSNLSHRADPILSPRVHCTVAALPIHVRMWPSSVWSGTFCSRSHRNRT
jgi:hypothetical protein